MSAVSAVKDSPLVQFALLAGPLLAMLDSSIVNVAVEPIARDLRAPLPSVQWTVSGYLLALGAGLAATSYLARRLGTLRTYRVSVVAFTLASAACALAPSVPFLVAARVAQGLLGAPLLPMAMSMLLGGGRGRQSAAAGMLLFLAPALGPSLGGGLIALGGWRWVFLVNLPIGAAAALAAVRIPPALAPGRRSDARLDLPGLLLLAAGLTSVLFAAGHGGTAGWSAPATWLPLTVGAVLLTAYATWAARRDQPALDLELLSHPTPALSVLLCALASVATYGAIFLIPVFAQSAQHHSTLATGLAMLPQGIVTGLSTMAGRWLLGRIAIRTSVLAGFTTLAAASAGLLVIGAHTPLTVTAAVLTGRSFAIGLVITPLLTATTASVARDRLADANTLFNICQRLAGSLGVTLIATLYAAHARVSGPVAALHLLGLVLIGVAALAAVLALRLPALGQPVPAR